MNKSPLWSDGYMTNSYVKSHYPESNPLNIRFVLENSGLVAPKISNVCELGCGYGHNLLVHAAANPTIQWTGFDFNPDFILYAQQTAKKFCIPNVEFVHQSFADLIHESKPVYDYIILHGVWSWISETNRDFLRQFIQKSLVLGGALYIGYNAKAGWHSLEPIRDLLYKAFDSADQSLSIDARVAKALHTCRTLIESVPSLSPLMERFSKIEQESPGYLCHEYLNKDWRLFYPSEVSQDLEDIGLQYVGSPHILSNLDSVNFNPDELAFLEQNRTVKEDLKSQLLNESYRRDLFVKGKIYSDNTNKSSSSLYMLMVSSGTISFVLDGPRSQSQLKEEIYWPIIERLAKEPCTLAMLHEVIDPAYLDEALSILIGHKIVALIRPEASFNEQSQAINLFNLLNIGKSSLPYISTRLGGEINIPIEHQCLALAWALNKALPVVICDEDLVRKAAAKTDEFYDNYLPLYKDLLVFQRSSKFSL